MNRERARRAWTAISLAVESKICGSDEPVLALAEQFGAAITTPGDIGKLWPVVNSSMYSELLHVLNERDLCSPTPNATCSTAGGDCTAASGSAN